MIFYIGKFCWRYVSSEGTALPLLADKRNTLHGGIRVSPWAPWGYGQVFYHLIPSSQWHGKSPGFKATYLKACLYDKELGLWARNSTKRDSLESRKKHTEMKSHGGRKMHQEMLRWRETLNSEENKCTWSHKELSERKKQRVHLLTERKLPHSFLWFLGSNEWICADQVTGSPLLPSCGF